MSVVLDCSYLLAWLMPDETRPASLDNVLAEPLVAPSFWAQEIASALRSAVRRQRIDEDAALRLCRAAEALQVDLLPVRPVTPADWFALARAHRLTPCDAGYLDLALHRRWPLATRDPALADAARRAGVVVHQ